MVAMFADAAPPRIATSLLRRAINAILDRPT
jgi:hypothetical protein